jgi:hypothetical protein
LRTFDTRESPAFQDDVQLSRLKNSVAFDFFDEHWFPLKGNREVIHDFPTRPRWFRPDGVGADKNGPYSGERIA